MFFLALAGLSSCQPYLHEKSQPIPSSIAIQKNKAIKITVENENELSRIYTIDDTGMITIPYIGQVQVDHKTMSQIEEDITRKLMDGYILQPKVYAEISAQNNVYILGAVKNPGQYEIPNDAALLINVIAIAGGYTAHAQKNSLEVLRQNEEGLQHYKKISPLTPLKPGDTIIVNEASFWK